MVVSLLTRLWQSKDLTERKRRLPNGKMVKEMVRSKMGGHWSSQEGWQISTCGRKSEGQVQKKYPKCVPLAKATRMTKGEKGECCQTKTSSR